MSKSLLSPQAPPWRVAGSLYLLTSCRAYYKYKGLAPARPSPFVANETSPSPRTTDI
jgi:hypothetical protein